MDLSTVIALASLFGCVLVTATVSVLGLAPSITWACVLTFGLTTTGTSFCLSAPLATYLPGFFSGLAWTPVSISAPIIVQLQRRPE